MSDILKQLKTNNRIIISGIIFYIIVTIPVIIHGRYHQLFEPVDEHEIWLHQMEQTTVYDAYTIIGFVLSVNKETDIVKVLVIEEKHLNSNIETLIDIYSNEKAAIYDQNTFTRRWNKLK